MLISQHKNYCWGVCGLRIPMMEKGTQIEETDKCTSCTVALFPKMIDCSGETVNKEMVVFAQRGLVFNSSHLTGCPANLKLPHNRPVSQGSATHC